MNSNDRKSALLAFVRDRYIDKVVGGEFFPIVTSIPQEGNPVAIICDYFLRKSTKTLDAICILCEMNFSEDALVLTRTIFEMGLYLQDILIMDSVDARTHKSTCFIFDGERQRLEKLKGLEKLKNSGKCAYWADAINSANQIDNVISMPENFRPPERLDKIAANVGGEWECWYHILYWGLSKLVHPSGLGSHTYLDEIDAYGGASNALKLAVSMHFSLIISVLSLLNLELLTPKVDEVMKEFISF